jgi:hypothetical protein
MKNKFVLTEEESKRILSLHKEKIDKERNIVSEEIEEQYTDEVMEIEDDDVKINYKNETAKLTRKLDLTKSVYGTNQLDYNVKKVIVGGAVFKPTTKGNLVSSATVEDPDTGKRVSRNIYYYCWPNKLRRNRDTVRKLQVGGSFYVPGGSISSGTQRELKKMDDLCEHMKYDKKEEEKAPTPTKSGCPSIVKSFTDAGYTQITEKRYKELANDKTRVRKHKFCSVTKKNLFFAKPQVTQTTPTPTPIPGGGGTNTGGTNTGGTNTGGGGQIYPFDYETILKAFPPEELINPYGQGGEEEPQQIIVTDEMYGMS